MPVVQFYLFGISLFALGVLLDRLVLRHEKIWLHAKLVQIWYKISETRFPDLVSIVTSRVEASLTRSIERRKLFSTLLQLTLLSWMLTSAAASVGAFMDGNAELNPYTWLPIFPVYFVAAFFVALTALSTIWSLRVGRRIGYWWKVLFSLLNVAISTVAAIASLPLLALVHNVAYAENWPGSGGSLARAGSPLMEIAFSIEDAMAPEIETHLREKGPIPFEYEKQNWKTNDFSTTGVKGRVEFAPGTTAESYRRNMASLRRYQRNIYDQEAESYYFAYRYSFGDFFIKSARQFLSNPWTWSPQLEGSYVAIGREWSTSANAFRTPSGRWAFILIASTPLFSVTVLALLILFLAIIKILFRPVAYMAMRLIDKSTEDDPQKSPEKFAPFTLFFTALGLLFHLIQILSALIGRLFA